MLTLQRPFFFKIAAIISLLGVLAHELLGAPMVLPPLHSTNLPTEIIWLHHFSWHVGSVAILTLMYLFWVNSRQNMPSSIVLLPILICLSFALLGTGLALFGDQVLWQTPAPYLWWVVFGVAVLGVSSKA